MSIAASIIASTLNAGTPLLIAAAGIVIHEKSVSYTHLTLPTICSV